MKALTGALMLCLTAACGGVEHPPVVSESVAGHDSSQAGSPMDDAVAGEGGSPVVSFGGGHSMTAGSAGKNTGGKPSAGSGGMPEGGEGGSDGGVPSVVGGTNQGGTTGGGSQAGSAGSINVAGAGSGEPSDGCDFLDRGDDFDVVFTFLSDHENTTCAGQPHAGFELPPVVMPAIPKWKGGVSEAGGCTFLGPDSVVNAGESCEIKFHYKCTFDVAVTIDVSSVQDDATGNKFVGTLTSSDGCTGVYSFIALRK